MSEFLIYAKLLSRKYFNRDAAAFIKVATSPYFTVTKNHGKRVEQPSPPRRDVIIEQPPKA